MKVYCVMCEVKNTLDILTDIILLRYIRNAPVLLMQNSYTNGFRAFVA